MAKRPIKIVAWGNSSGSCYWRLKDPFYLMNKTGEFDIRVTSEAVSREICEWADIMVTQSIVDKNGIALMYEYQQEHGKKIVVEQDDYFTVEKDNPYKLHHDVTNASEVVKITMGIADMVTASTDYLGNLLKEHAKNVVVLPNYMLMDRWDLHPKFKNTSGSVRILWAGSITHIDDMQGIKSCLVRISKDFPQTEFYFVGDIRMKGVFSDIERAEYMLGTDFLAWPDKSKGIRADIGIAPLMDKLFTRCKSWIKPLEMGINQMPVVASDVEPYRRLFDVDSAFPVRLAKTEDDWYRNLKELIENDTLRKEEGQRLYKVVRKNFDLEKHIKLWVDAYKGIL